METTGTMSKARPVLSLTFHCTQHRYCEQKSSKTMTLLLPSPRVLSGRESSLGSTFLCFSICPHKYQLQNFNYGSFHGDGSNTRRGAVAAARAQDPDRGHQSLALCTVHISLFSRCWVGSRPRGEGDTRGPCFRETLPSPAPVSHAQLEKTLFVLTFP